MQLFQSSLERFKQSKFFVCVITLFLDTCIYIFPTLSIFTPAKGRKLALLAVILCLLVNWFALHSTEINTEWHRKIKLDCNEQKT